MELFTLQCTTCQARLKVKDESAIGDIVACPKCGSMVQIVPPVGWQRKETSDSTVVAPRPSAIDTTAVQTKTPAPSTSSLSKSASAAKPASLSKAASLSKPGSSSQTLSASKTPPPTPAHSTPAHSTPAQSVIQPRKAAAVIPPALPLRHTPPAGSSITLDGLAPTAAAVSPAPPTGYQATTDVSPAATAAEPTPAATTPITWWAGTFDRIKADWPMLAGGLASGLLVGAVLWWALVPSSGPEIESVAIETVDASGAAVDAAVGAAAETAAGADSTEVAPPLAKSAPTETKPAESEIATAAAEPAIATEKVEAASEPTEATPAPATNAESTPPPSDPAPAQPATDTAAPHPGIKLAPDAAKAAPAPDREPAAPDAEPSAADDAPNPEAPATTPPPATRGSPGDAGAAHRLSAAEVDQRLAIELPKVTFRKVPLAQFVDFIGELAALPIAIDDEGLARAGHKRSVAVTVELSDTTARDALRTAVKPLGLTCIVRGGRLIVTSPAK